MNDEKFVKIANWVAAGCSGLAGLGAIFLYLAYIWPGFLIKQGGFAMSGFWFVIAVACGFIIYGLWQIAKPYAKSKKDYADQDFDFGEGK